VRKKLALAMVVSLTLVLLGAFFSSVHAAPPVQEQSAVKVSFLMAAIVGIMYYLALSPWFANMGFTVLYRPLVAGTLVGIVMGRPMDGMLIGAKINVLYLGWISAGGSLPGDPGLAGYLGTALALGGGLDHEQALALAAPLGLLGGLTWALRMSTCSIFAHIADSYAEKGDIRGVALSNYAFSQPFLFLIYAVPVALAAWLGSAAVAGALDWIGQHAGWVMSGLYVASGMLSALGIALNLKFLFRGSLFPPQLAAVCHHRRMRGFPARAVCRRYAEAGGGSSTDCRGQGTRGSADQGRRVQVVAAVAVLLPLQLQLGTHAGHGLCA